MAGQTRRRAAPSGFVLSEVDAAVAKGMIARGDRQHDIAAWFGVNGGRIAELATGRTCWWVNPAPAETLPPPGPYSRMKDAMAAIEAISHAEAALSRAKELVLSKTAH